MLGPFSSTTGQISNPSSHQRHMHPQLAVSRTIDLLIGPRLLADFWWLVGNGGSGERESTRALDRHMCDTFKPFVLKAVSEPDKSVLSESTTVMNTCMEL
jgi:hypothetical protein